MSRARFDRARIVRALAPAVASALLASCGGGGSSGPTTPPPATPVLTSVSVSLSAGSITVGQTATATAFGLDQNGTAIGVGTVTWSTASTAVATVGQSGIVTGVTPGQTQVVASAGGKQGLANITVTQAPVATVTVAPSASTLTVGATQQLTATTLDASGNVLAGRTVTWSSSDVTKATVSASGMVTAVAAGSAVITATSESRSGTAAITISGPPAPVATVTLAPGSASVTVGATVTLTATARDASGNALSGRVFSASSSNAAVATGSFTGNVLTITGVSAGTATLTATSEGQSGSATVAVAAAAAQCTSGTALQMNLGDVRTLTAAQVASLCLGGGASATEYALISFGNSTVAASTVPVQVAGTNTAAIVTPPLALRAGGAPALVDPSATSARLGEQAFRNRELRDLTPVFARYRASPRPARLTAVPANPTVGSVVQLNVNLSGNTCAAPKQLHFATVVAVLPHTIVFADSTAPAGGYTAAEMAAFGTAFDTLGFGLDTLNFGAPTDIDGNGRIGIFFTPGVNALPGPAGGGFIGGLFASRDLFPVTPNGCPASNEGEMFYLPVPDPSSTINGNYKDKTTLSNIVLATLVHEFQHLINAGRRIVVNNAPGFEELWLNEGLSHTAEELLYYRISGNAPRSNIGLALLRSTQAQLDAVNTYQIQNLGRLMSLMKAPETNSPYSLVDGLAMRGAIWELLRYSADRKGGTERALWSALVNTTASGQANFDAVMGDITTLARDWAVAQFTGDAGLGVAANYTNPSWNFRSILPAINNGTFPLLTHALAGTPVNVTLAGGGAAYIRFRVASGVPATITSTSSGAAVPATVDFILVRTQ